MNGANVVEACGLEDDDAVSHFNLSAISFELTAEAHGMQIYVHACVCICMHVYMNVCVYIYINIYSTFINTYAESERVHSPAYSSLYSDTTPYLQHVPNKHIHTYIHTYIHTHIHTYAESGRVHSPAYSSSYSDATPRLPADRRVRDEALLSHLSP